MYTTLPKLIAAGHFMVDKICLIFPETGICSLCNKKKKKNTFSHGRLDRTQIPEIHQ